MTKTTGEDSDAVLEYHQVTQEKVISDMLHFTRDLKEQSQIAQNLLLKDTEVIEFFFLLIFEFFIKKRKKCLVCITFYYQYICLKYFYLVFLKTLKFRKRFSSIL